LLTLFVMDFLIATAYLLLKRGQRLFGPSQTLLPFVQRLPLVRELLFLFFQLVAPRRQQGGLLGVLCGGRPYLFLLGAQLFLLAIQRLARLP
jgi:hypothetical protein